MATTEKQQERRTSTSQEGSSSSYAWLVGFAILTIVGILVWVLVANSEDGL